jgi:hypothetical protein
MVTNAIKCTLVTTEQHPENREEWVAAQVNIRKELRQMEQQSATRKAFRAHAVTGLHLLPRTPCTSISCRRAGDRAALAAAPIVPAAGAAVAFAGATSAAGTPAFGSGAAADSAENAQLLLPATLDVNDFTTWTPDT